jgi:hypothetical protein
LNASGSNYTGSAEFQATLWDAASGGNAVATNSPASIIVGVTNGLFILPLDFATNFPGAARWLQLDVRTAIGPFTTLTPRQPLLPVPYAITAGNLAGNLPATQLTGTLPLGQLPGAVLTNGAGGVILNGSFTGDGGNVTNVNAETLNGIPSGKFWQLDGNNVGASQFLGSTNNQPLELRANNQTGLRLINTGSNGVNVVGGWSGNNIAAGVIGAVIAGGGAGDYNGSAYTNSIGAGANFASIGGGYFNTIQTNAYDSTIGGGYRNTIQTNAYESTIGGGYVNTVQTNARYSTIGGGYGNTVQPNAYASTIGGGEGNTVQPDADYSAIGGGYQNTIQTNANYSTIGGGYINTVQANADSSTIGGGRGNIIQTTAYYSTIGGGYYNIIRTNSLNAAIPGGYLNAATNNSFAAGHQAKANHEGSFVWADSHDSSDFTSTANYQFLIRAAGGVGINTNAPAATLDVNGSLRVGFGTTIFKNLQGGLAQMSGGSTTAKTNFTFTFPKPFSNVPNVILSARSGNSVPVDDTFAVTARVVTTTNCTVNLVRVDTSAGWSQSVIVNWLGWE